MDRASAAPPRASDDWAALSADPLPVAVAGRWVVRPDCGATVIFTGTARDHAEGRPGVHRLEYEAYEEPAARAAARHRRRGAPAVAGGRAGGACCTAPVSWSSVTRPWSSRCRAPHRGEAFDAARFAIDELKRTVPIWKRESWDGGESWGLEAQHLTEVGQRLMQAVLFLAIAVVVCAIGGLVLYVQHRQPNTMESGMDSFRREMDALAPPPDEPAPEAPDGQASHAPQPATAVRPGAVAAVARDLAIDLGTANTLVYERGRGIVLNEPTVIALNERTQEVLAMGHEAWQMIGRTPGYIVAVRPLRQGAITDFEITQRMIRLLLHRVGVNRFNRPRVVICVPSAITEVERRAVTEAARRAGAADAQLIEQPMAAAIGAALPIHEPVANMVVDVGGGTSETALISLGGVVALKAVRVGSFDIDAAITAFIRREYGIAVGERTAEEIKMAIGSAAPVRDEIKAEVRGRDLMSGLPKTIILSPDEVRAAIDEPVSAICDSVVACLGMSPPELAQDLILNGVKLVGGGGMLAGFDQRLANETEVPVHLVDAPLECVVLGAGRCIEAYDSLKVMFMGSNR